jgi:hypothetical protein
MECKIVLKHYIISSILELRCGSRQWLQLAVDLTHWQAVLLIQFLVWLTDFVTDSRNLLLCNLLNVYAVYLPALSL